MFKRTLIRLLNIPPQKHSISYLDCKTFDIIIIIIIIIIVSAVLCPNYTKPDQQSKTKSEQKITLEQK